jgi:hypothetical protein
VGIPHQRVENVTIVLFRAAPVSLTDLVNPQTLNKYSGVELIQSKGLAAFERTCSFYDRRLRTTFLEPFERFYVKLQSGAGDNELLKVTRAFAMNVEETPEEDLEDDLAGIGYLVADNPFLLDIASKSAVSMAHVNGRRLDLQNRYGMADARTNAYHEKVRTRLAESQSLDPSNKEAVAKAREAVTYATLNHPVLRESIFEAVAGIMCGSFHMILRVSVASIGWHVSWVLVTVFVGFHQERGCLGASEDLAVVVLGRRPADFEEFK